MYIYVYVYTCEWVIPDSLRLASHGDKCAMDCYAFKFLLLVVQTDTPLIYTVQSLSHAYPILTPCVSRHLPATGVPGEHWEQNRETPTAVVHDPVLPALVGSVPHTLSAAEDCRGSLWKFVTSTRTVVSLGFTRYIWLCLGNTLN